MKPCCRMSIVCEYFKEHAALVADPGNISFSLKPGYGIKIRQQTTHFKINIQKL